MKRITEHRPMSGEGHKLIFGQRHRGRTDDVLLAAIDQRWAALLDLPMPEGQTLADAQSLIDEVEARRTEALRGID